MLVEMLKDYRRWRFNSLGLLFANAKGNPITSCYVRRDILHPVREGLGIALRVSCFPPRPELMRISEIHTWYRSSCDMPTSGIYVQVLSLTSPGTEQLEADDVMALARESSDLLPDCRPSSRNFLQARFTGTESE